MKDGSKLILPISNLMQDIISATIVFFGLVSISFLFTKRVKIRRESLSLLDKPNERSSHTIPTVSGGGIPIVLITITSQILCWLLIPDLFDNTEWIIIILCGGIVGAISWFDDIKPVSSIVRYGAHSTVALLIIYFIDVWQRINFPFLGQIELEVLSLPLTFLWITGLINIYNFMDGIDGIAGTQAILASIAWVYFSYGSSVGSVIFIITLAIIASTSGFLILNWHPAKIFMGDVGSAFLGYTFAIIPLMFNRLDNNSNALLLGIIAIYPFIFDGSFTILRRLLNKENIFKAHRSHIYQKLVISGMRHSSVTLLYLFFMVLGLMSGIIYSRYDNLFITTIILVIVSLLMVVSEKLVAIKTQG